MKFKSSTSWDKKVLSDAYNVLHEIYVDQWGFEIYNNRIEIVTYEQMINAMSLSGLPLSYNHWSFGKKFFKQHRSYRKGILNLPYELVINSSPCISYNLENNSFTEMIIVLAHAAFGHNHFFKNNYLFKLWTSEIVDNLIEFLNYAKSYVLQCEEKYGINKVEELIDICHSLYFFGVFKYKDSNEKRSKLQTSSEHIHNQIFDKVRLNPAKIRKIDKDPKKVFNTELKVPEENLLYFLEKYGNIKDWEREIICIVRTLCQYYYPQYYTRLMNEGWATFSHYMLMNELYKRGNIDDGIYLEFIDLHCNISSQPDYRSTILTGQINPYYLGFKMFKNLHQVITEPTKENYNFFGDIAGKNNWQSIFKNIIEDYRDESFILQYLSPELVEEERLMVVEDQGFEEDVYEDHPSKILIVKDIQNKEGFKNIREALSKHYDFFQSAIPEVYIEDIEIYKNNSMHIKVICYDRRRISLPMLKNTAHMIKSLWSFDVEMQVVSSSDKNTVLTKISV